MPQSFASVVVHLIFATKGRHPWLKDPATRRELYAYMATILKALDSTPIAINGTADHVHIVCAVSRNHAIAKIVEEVKKQPSKWLKRKGREYKDFYWQSGYAVFSVSVSRIPGGQAIRPRPGRAPQTDYVPGRVPPHLRETRDRD